MKIEVISQEKVRNGQSNFKRYQQKTQSILKIVCGSQCTEKAKSDRTEGHKVLEMSYKGTIISDKSQNHAKSAYGTLLSLKAALITFFLFMVI